LTKAEPQFFGHPRGLATLFFTEMWERFSYYGMRALLILFMTAAVTKGGLGFDTETAGIIYGLYTSLVYLISLPGGWLADRLLGQQRAVLVGGVLIMLGQFSLGIDSLATFYAGLGLIILGTGLLKPNVSVLVGHLYKPEDQRRDAGFSIFYMGINLGAFLAPLICSYIGERVNWRLGFAVAGVGMALGLVQYLLGAKWLAEGGSRPAAPLTEAERRKLWFGLAGMAGVIGVLAYLTAAGAISTKAIGDGFGLLLLVIVIAVFTWLIASKEWTKIERRRFLACAALFAASTLFWSAFEQAGSTLNLFAVRSTANRVLGFDYPAGWLQSLNSLFLIAMAPGFAWLWLKLGPREPSSPAKFSWGLILVGLGFAVMTIPARGLTPETRTSPLWLVLCYFLHTCGELCLSPVGLSAMTKLAPPKVTGLMMGVWFVSISAGNYIGGRVAAVYENFSTFTLFSAVAAFGIVAGLILAALGKPIRSLMGGVK
jgi:POT family proton-dependent oligopeptide transporter